MSVININELKTRFNTGDLPAKKDYLDLIDTLLAQSSSATVNLPPGAALFYAVAAFDAASGTYSASYPVVVTAYVDGTVLAFKASNVSGSAANVPFTGVTYFDGGAGAYPIKKLNGVNLAAGDICDKQIVEVRFDGVANVWKLISATFRPAHRAGDLVASFSAVLEDSTRLLCDGRTVSLIDYPTLAVIAAGHPYGTPSPNDSDHVKLPDLTRRFPVGAASSGTIVRGTKAGAETHTLTADELPAHNHSDGLHTYLLRPPYVYSLTGSDHTGSGTEQAVGENDGGAIQTVGAGHPHDIMPPYLGVYYYILL